MTPAALLHQAQTHLQAGRVAEAHAACEQVLRIESGNTDALALVSRILLAANRPDAAVAAYRRALAAHPRQAELHNNLGNLLLRLKRPGEAEIAFRDALRISPEHPVIHCNLGKSLIELRRPADALAEFRRASSLDPAGTDAHFYEGYVLLLTGDYRHGWPKFEHRWTSELKAGQREFAQPLWLGRGDLRGKTLLLHAEQGMGDSLQFVRYLPQVAALGARIILEVQPALIRLFRGLPGVAGIVPRGDPLPPFDFHCPLMSLPHAFGTELATIPAAVPYLQAPADLVDRWRPEFGATRELKVGIAWSGNPKQGNDYNRSMPLAALKEAFAGLPVRLHCFPKEINREDAATLAASPEIKVHSGQVDDLADTAAVMAHLDLVVSVDTSVAHLAGALARPAWVLLCAAPDWRWMLEGETNPWYPTLRLFRQSQPGDWSTPVRQVNAALRQLLAERKG